MKIARRVARNAAAKEHNLGHHREAQRLVRRAQIERSKWDG